MRKIIIIDNAYEYDYEVVGNTHTLYYSMGEEYMEDCRGEICMRVIDTGNGLKITEDAPQKKKNNLDYGEALYLSILLRIINADYIYEMADKIKF